MPAPSPTARSPHRAPISAEAARGDQIDNDQFEKKARELSAPTPWRPALVSEDEIDAMRTRYTTGAGRLDALTKTAAYRDAYHRETAGSDNFDPISDEQRAKAKAFFDAHGDALEPPAPEPEPEKPPRPAGRPLFTPPYCSLAIRFLATNGLACELTVYGVTAADALDRGRDAMKRLVEAGVKPIGGGG